MSNNDGRCLAIDYGLARVGLAMSDPNRIIASPIPAVATDGALLHVKQLVENENIAEIIVGLPYHMNGTMSEMGEEALEFVRLLRSELDVDIKTQDERLSTVEAERALNSAETKPKRRDRARGRTDSAAAAIVLQGYLESQKSNR